jgi:hypothetical protein
MFYPQKCISDNTVCVIEYAYASRVVPFMLHGSYAFYIWPLKDTGLGSEHVVATFSPCHLALFLPSFICKSIEIQAWS